MSSKAELRALMRKKAAERGGSVNHPLAKFTSSGLQCRLCQVGVATDGQWPAHLKSARHVELTKQFRKKTKPSGAGVMPPPAKRPAAAVSAAVAAAPAPPSSLPPGFFDAAPASAPAPAPAVVSAQALAPSPASTPSSTLPPGFFDAGVKPSSTPARTPAPAPAPAATGLPPGFFDNPANIPVPPAAAAPAPGTTAATAPSSGTLPVGFFDDANADAKARGGSNANAAAAAPVASAPSNSADADLAALEAFAASVPEPSDEIDEEEAKELERQREEAAVTEQLQYVKRYAAMVAQAEAAKAGSKQDKAAEPSPAPRDDKDDAGDDNTELLVESQFTVADAHAPAMSASAIAAVLQAKRPGGVRGAAPSKLPAVAGVDDSEEESDSDDDLLNWRGRGIRR